MCEDAGILLGVDWEAMLVIENAELALLRIKLQLEFAAIEDSAVLIAQDRDQNFELQFIFERFPIDVEKFGVRGRLTVLENVEPPGVVGSHHTHVVRHDVEDLPHAVLAQRSNEGFEIFNCTDLGIENLVINNVVTMRASRASLEIR